MANQLVLAPVRDRGGMILLLGILSFVIGGPLTGIPAWLMARQDLRDLEAGLIPESSRRELKIARGVAMIGTFLSPLWVWLFAMLVFVLVMVVGEMFFAAIP